MKIGFFGLLALLFIGLKLGGAIDWSWWWVTAPLWGGAAVGLLILFIGILATSMMFILEALMNKRNKNGRRY